MILFGWALASADDDPHVPHGADVSWHTRETRFFRVHWSQTADGSAEATSARAAEICDTLLLRLSAQAGFVPRGRYDLVVSDATDGMVAYARPGDRVVVIGTDPGSAVMRLRGRADWVEDALAHEIGHLVWDRRSTPFATPYGVEGLGSVQIGPVAAGIDLFLVHDLPYGYGEALAEVASQDAGVNHFDERRAGLLRVGALEGRLLTWDEWTVGADKGDVLDAERAYQQGYAFLSWLRQEAGPDVLAQVSDRWSRRPHADLSAVLGEVTGTTGREWWARHRGHLTVEALVVEADRLGRAAPRGRELEDPPRSGLSAADARASEHPREDESRREATGSWELAPRASPDGRFYAEGKAFAVRVVKRDEPAARVPKGSVAWIPGRTGIGGVFAPDRDAIYTITDEDPGRPGWWPDGPRRPAVFAVGLDVDRDGDLLAATPRGMRRVAERVPGTERAREVTVTPRGDLVLVRHADGGDQLWAGPPGSATQRTTFPPHTWLQGPSVSPDGARLAVSVFRENRGEVWVAELPSWRWSRVPLPLPDVLDPTWTADGRLWATAAVDGVWQVIRVDPSTGAVDVVTHTVAGASTPSAGPDGALWFTATTASGFKASSLDAVDVWPAPVDEAVAAVVPLPTTPSPPSSPYLARPRTPTVGPLLRLDTGPATRGSPAGPRVAAGGWFDTRDVLDTWWVEVFALAGTVSGGEVELGWAGLGAPVTLEASGATTSDAARWTGRFELATAWSYRPGVEVAPSIAWIRSNNLESRRAIVAIRGSDPPGRMEAGTDGGVWLTAAHSDGALGPTSWLRAEVELRRRSALGLTVGPLDENAVSLEWAVRGGVTSRDVDRREALAIGGDLWTSWRPLAVEASLPFPASPPWARTGRHAGAASARMVVPVAPRWRTNARGLYLQGLELAPGADVAAVAPRSAVFAAGVAELRLRARWSDRPLHSSLVVAKSIGDEPPRVYLEIGGAPE